MAQMNLPPGFELVEEPVQNGLPAGFLVEQAAPPERAPQDSTTGTALTGAIRTGPMALRGTARLAADHPAATQKIIGVGVRTAAGAAGAGLAGVPGAVIGASLAGVTPKQTTIRHIAGRLSGESAAVAKDAAKSLGITNYAKEFGVKVGPNDLIPKPNPANAIEHFANSTGEKGVLRIYDEFGRVVSGPNTAPPLSTPKPKPGIFTKAAGVVGPVVSRVLAASGVGDLAQTAEPNRRDIGFMGIGASQPPDDWSRQQAAMRARILAMFGL